MRFPMCLRWPAAGQSYLQLGMGSASFRGFGSVKRRLADTHVGSAAAKIPPQSLLYRFHCGVRILVEEGFDCHDESRSAKTTLLRIVLNKGRRDRMDFAARAETFDSLNV